MIFHFLHRAGNNVVGTYVTPPLSSISLSLPGCSPIAICLSVLLGDRSFEMGGMYDPNTIDTIQQSSKK